MAENQLGKISQVIVALNTNGGFVEVGASVIVRIGWVSRKWHQLEIVLHLERFWIFSAGVCQNTDLPSCDTKELTILLHVRDVVVMELLQGRRNRVRRALEPHCLR